MYFVQFNEEEKNTYCWVYIQFQFNWYLFQSWTVTLKWVIFHQPWCTEYSFSKVGMTHILGRLVSFDIPGFISFLKFQCTLSQPLKRKMHNFSDVGDIERIVSNNCHNLFKNNVTQKSKLEKWKLLGTVVSLLQTGVTKLLLCEPWHHGQHHPLEFLRLLCLLLLLQQNNVHEIIMFLTLLFKLHPF